jgi:exopolysaccharide biosynthesis polyprenyl glycosylphosphotransferase
MEARAIPDTSSKVGLQEAYIKPDLRAPLSNFFDPGIRLRRGILVGVFRVASLVIQDLLLLTLAWWLTTRETIHSFQALLSPEQLLIFLPIAALCIGIMFARGLYKPGVNRRDYFGIIKSISLAIVLIAIINVSYQLDTTLMQTSVDRLAVFWGLSIVLIGTGRFWTNLLIETARARGAVHYPAFLICGDDAHDKTVELIQRENRYDIRGRKDVTALDRQSREATFEEMRRLGIAEAFVSWDAIERRLFLCWHFQKAGITLHILPTDLQPLFVQPEVWMMRGLPTLRFGVPTIAGLNFWFKRCFDFCSALVLFLLLSPILLVISVLIKLDSEGPIFYKQTRLGLHGQQFNVWKFRTMVQNADKLQKELEAKNENKDGVLFKMKDDPRITRVGKFLRRYSLDELPQIINVLMGEMSLVGPRPLPLRDVQRFNEYHFIRQEVLPGITGMWQVSGRSEITDFDQVMRLDMNYIENWSLWLDLKILMKTFLVVLKKTGAY